MKKYHIYLVFVLSILFISTSLAQTKKVNYSIQKIWNNDTYNAFTSLLRYRHNFLCSFREGRGHIFNEKGIAEGQIRILSSKDGKKWKSVTLMGEKGMDFRDPKLSIAPDGRLMLSIGVSIYRNKELQQQLPYVSFSSDGEHFSKPEPCSVENQPEHRCDWLWRVTWNGNTGYVVNYFTKQDGTKGLWLMTTQDGKRYQKLTELQVPDFPNEATVRFLPNGQMGLMVRRDAGDCMGYWAVSNAPYTEWNWKKMPFRLGGPDFLMMDNHRMIACSRCHHIGNHCTTSVYVGDAQSAKFEQRLVLPSGGDTSYPGMLIVGKELWISYYSGHESHWPQIYLAKIPLSVFQ